MDVLANKTFKLKLKQTKIIGFFVAFKGCSTFRRKRRQITTPLTTLFDENSIDISRLKSIDAFTECKAILKSKQRFVWRQDIWGNDIKHDDTRQNCKKVTFCIT